MVADRLKTKTTVHLTMDQAADQAAVSHTAATGHSVSAAIRPPLPPQKSNHLSFFECSLNFFIFDLLTLCCHHFPENIIFVVQFLLRATLYQLLNVLHRFDKFNFKVRLGSGYVCDLVS